MSKSGEDKKIIIERMRFYDHQGEHKINPFYRKFDIMELNTGDVILAHNKFLTQMVDELTNNY